MVKCYKSFTRKKLVCPFVILDEKKLCKKILRLTGMLATQRQLSLCYGNYIFYIKLAKANIN